jgi:hypothetical protein
LDQEDDYPKYRGRLQAVVLVSIALSSVLGGFIGEYSLVLTFTITAGLMAVATGFLLLLKEPPRESAQTTEYNPSYWDILRVAFGAIREHPTLRYALLYSAIVPLMGGTIQVTFMQPYALSIGLPIAALGVIALSLRASQFTGSLSASRVIHKFGEWRWLRFAVFVIVLGVISLGVFNSVVGIVLFALTGFASAVTGPLIESTILRQIPGSIRATILSVDSLLHRILLAVASPLIGYVADQNGLPVAFICVGVGFGITLAVLLYLWGRIRQKP